MINRKRAKQSLHRQELPTLHPVLLHYDQRGTLIPNVTLNNRRIRYCSEIKFLRIYFDSNLTWNPHLNFLKNKFISYNTNLAFPWE